MYTFKTNTAVWTFDRRITRLGTFRLPFSVSFRQMGIAVATFLLVLLVGKVVPLPWKSLWYVALPIVSAYYLGNAVLDGKSPISWMQTIIAWAWMPKRWADGQPFKKQKKLKFRARCKAAGG